MLAHSSSRSSHPGPYSASASAFLCTDLGIASASRADRASYIASWLKLLEDEPRAVFDAATQAQQAVEFLHALHDGNAAASGASATAAAA